MACRSTTKYNKACRIVGFVPIVTDVLGSVSLNCSPLTVVGTGSGCETNQEPLCCSNEKYVRTQPSFSMSDVLRLLLQNGLINIGCTPINLFL